MKAPFEDYRDIPGTYVFDGRHQRQGYGLNMFCKSLDSAGNREAFRADPAAYLDRHSMTASQRGARMRDVARHARRHGQ